MLGLLLPCEIPQHGERWGRRQSHLYPPTPSSACKVPPPMVERDAVVHWEILRYLMLAISDLVIVEINLKAHNLRTFEHFDSNRTAHSLQPTTQPHSDCACINVPASRALAHLHFHGNLVECDANMVIVRSCSSGRAANVCTPLHCHSHPIWTPDSKFSGLI